MWRNIRTQIQILHLSLLLGCLCVLTMTETSSDCTWAMLIRKLLTVESSIEFCREYKLLPREECRDCVDCKGEKTVKLCKLSRDVHFPFQLWCKKCKKISSFRTNTWFANCHMSIEQNMILVYSWINGFTHEVAASETNLSTNTVADYYHFCREVCYVMVTNNTTAIGGEGKVVEVDESHIRTRKFGKGRVLRNEFEKIWVFGGIERQSRKCFLVKVQTRDSDTLVPLLKQFVLPGTTIITDGWKSYGRLKEEGFNHHFVNHSIEFVRSDDPLVHTQNIERLWKSVKSSTKREGRPTDADDMYVFQYLYFHHLRWTGKKVPSQILPVFLKDIALVYPGYGMKGLVPAVYGKDEENLNKDQ